MSVQILDRAKIEVIDGITVEYRLAPKMVVFSHGFGVRRDSRGMFTDTVAQLPENWGYVLFEYNDEEHGLQRVTTSSEQVARLRKVTDWARSQPEVAKIDIVGHSRGCIITALANIERFEHVVLLAPPLASGHTREYFTNKPGAYRDGANWYVPRSDGSTTILPEEVLDEFETLNLEKTILEYAARQPLWVVQAGADGILDGQDYGRLAADPHVTFRKIGGATHDFVGEARQKMIDCIFEALQVDGRND